MATQLEEGVRHSEAEKPLTLTRLRFNAAGGKVAYVFVPKGRDILLEWCHFVYPNDEGLEGEELGVAKAEAFLNHLYDEGVADADVDVDVELPLD